MSHSSSYHIKTEIPLAPSPKIMSSTVGAKMGLQALAEVAIGRLLEEQDEAAAAAAAATSTSTKIINRAYTLKQIRKLSEKKLLSTFSVRTKRAVDKHNKRFEYRCTILPHICQQAFDCPVTPAAEEANLKETVLKHLHSHLCNLEKMEPAVKITCRRAVKTRPPTVKKEEKGSAIAVAKKSSGKKGVSGAAGASATTAIAVGNVPTGVIIGGGAPLDMSTTSAASSLALKFLEEDHPYTAPTDPALVARSGILTEALNSAGITPDAFPLTPTATTEHHLVHHDGVGTSGIVVIDGTTSAVMIDQHQQNLQHQQAAAASIPISSNANVRALALDYIDDIRKKSSSAAKPVISAVNGDKSLIYQCKICPDKQFTSTNGLIFHYKKHAGLKPYVCELCSATFTRQHSLNYHMLIHLNKSRFVCQECGRHFRHPSHFKEHLRRHTGETPFQCADCLIRFKTRNTYKRHLQTKHSKILTSKGIIEISQAGGAAGGTYSESGVAVASTSGGTSVKAIKPRSSKYAAAMKYGSLTTPVAPAAAVAVAPALQSTYEPQVLNVLPTQPIDYSQQPQNLSMHQHHQQPQHLPSTTAATPITIVQLPGVTGVHILDNSGALTTTASADGGSYHHQHLQHHQTAAEQHMPITLVSYHHQQPQPHQSQHLHQHQHPTSSLEPIQPSTATLNMNSPPISSGPLTELTSSPALGMVHHHHQQHQQQQSMMQQAHQHQPPPLPPPPSNDNFNMLLAAIEMTEDHPKHESSNL